MAEADRKGKGVLKSNATVEISQRDLEARKKKQAIVARNFLQNLPSTTTPHLLHHPEFKNWEKGAKDAISAAKFQKVEVAVMGLSGSGKTSLINAILEGIIFPCSTMRASTSAPTKISYNESNDPEERFRAEVLFETKEEWETEFKDLVFASFLERDEETPTFKASYTASATFAKLTAVYPGVNIANLIATPETNLPEPNEATRLLGQKITIAKSDLEQFRIAISTYIDSSNKTYTKGEPAKWPLVREVRVFLKKEVLRKGLTIVDLPGLGDSNAARREVAQKILQTMDKIWIVSNIVRAVDDGVARELMDDAFKTHLFRNGKYNSSFVTFILTQTDGINVDETIEALQQTDEIKRILQREKEAEVAIKNARASIKTIKQQRKEIIKSLNSVKDAEVVPNLRRKRKAEALDTPSQSIASKAADTEPNDANLVRKSLLDQRNQCNKDLEAVPDIIEQGENDLQVCKSDMRTVCIEERNAYATQHLQMDFEEGLLEFQEQLKEFSTDESLKASAAADSSTQIPKLFCVSSLAFQIAQGRLKRENQVVGFPTIEHTGIPALQRFAQSIASVPTNKTDDIFLEGMERLRMDMGAWARGSVLETLSPQQEKDILTALKVWAGTVVISLNKSYTDFVASIKQDMNDIITENLPRYEKKAAIMAPKSFGGLGNHASSWKATCRKFGVHESVSGNAKTRRTKTTHDWNTLFAHVFLKVFMASFKEVVLVRSQIHSKLLKSTIEEALESSASGFRAKVHDLLGHNNRAIESIVDSVMLSVKNDVLRNSTGCLKVWEKDVNKADFLVESVKKSMMPYYKEAVTIGKKNVLPRLQEALRKHFKANSLKMFQGTSAALENNTNAALDRLSSNLKGSTLTFAKRIFKNVRNTVKEPQSKKTDASAGSSVRKLQREISFLLEELKGELKATENVKHPSIPKENDELEPLSEAESYEDEDEDEEQEEDEEENEE